MAFVKICKSLCLFSQKTNFEIVLDDHPVRKQALPKHKKLNLQSYQIRLLLMIQLEKKHSQTKKIDLSQWTY